MVAETNSPGYIETIASSRKKTRENLKVDQLIPSEILDDSGSDGIKLLLEKYYEFMNMSEFIYDKDETYNDLVLDNSAFFRIEDPNLENNKFFSDFVGTASTLKVTSTTGNLPAAISVELADINVGINDTIQLTANQANQAPIGTLVKYTASENSIGGLSNNAFYYVVYNNSNKIKLSSSPGGSAITLNATGSGTHTIEGSGPTIVYPISRSNIVISNGNELPGTLGAKKDIDDDTEEGIALGKTFQVTGLHGLNGTSAELTTPNKNWVGPGPSYVLNSIEDAMDIDKNSDPSVDPTNQYLEMMQKEIAEAIPRSQQGISVNKSTLYKRIIDFYKVRGSSDSVEMFFRLLFDEEVEIHKPYDDTLIPSSGNWDTGTEQFVSRKGFVSDAKIRLHDNDRYQKYSYLIKSGLNKTTWDQVYSRLVHPAGFKFFAEISILIQAIRAKLKNAEGAITDNDKGVFEEIKNLATGDFVNQFIAHAYPSGANRLALSSMPGIQPGIIGIEDLPLLIEMVASTFEPSIAAYINQTARLSPTIVSGELTAITVSRAGGGYVSPPSITITGSSANDNATATCTLNALGGIEEVTVSDGGSGYTTDNINITIGALTTPAGRVGRIEIPLQARRTGDGHNLVDDAPFAALNSDNEGWTTVVGSGTTPQGLPYLEFGDGGKQLPGRTDAPIGEYFKVCGYVNTVGNVGGCGLAIRGSETEASPNILQYGGSQFPSGLNWTYFEHIFQWTNFDNTYPGEYWTIAIDIGGGASQGDTLKLAGLHWELIEEPSLPGNKLYSRPPTIEISAPTATDEDGNLLPLGTDYNDPDIRIQATAKFLMQPTGVQYIKMLNRGQGYTYDTLGIDVSDPAYPTDYLAADEPYYVVTEIYPNINADGGIDGIYVLRPGKGHIEPPTITITDTGVGQGAEAEALMYPSELTSVEITNTGKGYQFNPKVTINSSMIDRNRIREVLNKVIIPLNHTFDGSQIIDENDYFKRKGNSYYDSSKKFDMNQTIEQFGDQTISTNHINTINTFNINPFIDIE